MDGTGQEQDTGATSQHDNAGSTHDANAPSSLKGSESNADETVSKEGALAKDKGKQAVNIQSVVTPGGYAGSSESGG